MDYEKAEINFKELIREVSDRQQPRNEAATRLHFIDELLHNCLGWPKREMDPERHHAGDYSDYELGYPAPRLVVEAKKEGEYFDLPVGLKKENVSIKTIFQSSKSAEAAIIQAIGYCKDRSIPIGAICNGHQLIVFLGSRQDGTPPENGKAVIFESRDDMLSRFQSLWNLLSFEGVKINAAQRILARGDFVSPPPKLSKGLLHYPGHKNRNPSATDLQIIGGLFLEDIAAIPQFKFDFVKETYCLSGALSQYAMVSREILSSRYNVYFKSEQGISATPARNKKGLDKSLQQDLVAASIKARPILLVGDAGVGKSMFIEHLVQVDARQELQTAVVIRVDFGKNPAIADELQTYVRNEMKRQLLDIYSLNIDEGRFVRRVYKKELELFEAGIYGSLKSSNSEKYEDKELDHLGKLSSDAAAHLQNSIEYIVRHNNKQFVLFLDNVDQRPANFQDQVFLIGQSFASRLPATVFISLRPETFAHSRSLGSLSAYQPRVFTIEPPRVEKVILKRLEYGLKKIRETGTLSELQAIHFTSEKLESYMSMLIYAFKTSEDLMLFIDNMSNGNLRKALDFITMFVGSGHVDSEKIFRIIDESGKYNLPFHEFLRAVIHGDNRYFDPTRSPIANVYDTITDDPQEHFLTISLLVVVENSATDLSSEGFVPIALVYTQLQSLGFSEHSIKSVIDRCISKELLSPPRIYAEGDYDRIRINSAGAYTYKRLIKTFAYTDPIIVDTPIISNKFRKNITDAERLHERLTRAIAFLDYLDSCWNEGLNALFDWKVISTEIRSDISLIYSRNSHE